MSSVKLQPSVPTTVRPVETPAAPVITQPAVAPQQESGGWIKNAYSKARQAGAAACEIYRDARPNLEKTSSAIGQGAMVLSAASVGLGATGIGAPVAAGTGTLAAAAGTVSLALDGVNAAGRALCENDLGGVKDIALGAGGGKVLGAVAQRAMPAAQAAISRIAGNGSTAAPAVPDRIKSLLTKWQTNKATKDELAEIDAFMKAQRNATVGSAAPAAAAKPVVTPTPAARPATPPPAAAAPPKPAAPATPAPAAQAAATQAVKMSSQQARAVTVNWPDLNLKRAGMTEIVDAAGAPIRQTVAAGAKVGAKSTPVTIEQFYSNAQGFGRQVGNTFDWSAGRELTAFAERMGKKPMTPAALKELEQALDATIANAKKAVGGKPERQAVLEGLESLRAGLGNFTQAVKAEAKVSVAISNVKVGPSWAND